jgi:hypothetical protein
MKHAKVLPGFNCPFTHKIREERTKKNIQKIEYSLIHVLVFALTLPIYISR